jgi:NAD(P)-dependent dehydrogenase (short-subunit alcohol dehydrogenase family)
MRVEAIGPLTEITEEKYRAVFDINVWSVLAAMKHEIPAMLKNGGEAVVYTTSTFGRPFCWQRGPRPAKRMSSQTRMRKNGLPFAGSWKSVR